MGIFSGGEKYYRLAEGVNAKAYNLQKQQQYEEFNRSLLSDVRQARIAAATLQQSNYSEEFTGSGPNSAVANVYSNLAGSYGYAIDSSKRLAEIQTLNTMASKLQKKGQKRDERSAQAAQIVTSGLQIAGAFIGGPAGAAIGGAVGAGLVKAMGGGKAATKTANSQAVKGAIQAVAFSGLESFTSIGNAAKGAEASGGKLIGTSNSGLKTYDLTGTFNSGRNVNIYNGYYEPTPKIVLGGVY